VIRRALFGLAVLASLGACAEGGASGAVRSSAEVGPGSVPVDLLTATTLFQRVCVDTAPGFQTAPQAISGLPFTYNTRSEIYYHDTLNLSFKLVPSPRGTICSMVLFSNEQAGVLAIAMGVAASGDGNIGIDPASGASTANGPAGTRFVFEQRGVSDGVAFYNASLAPG